MPLPESGSVHVLPTGPQDSPPLVSLLEEGDREPAAPGSPPSESHMGL